MELLVMLGALGILGVFAVKFGVDSNDRLQSKEEELACFGVQWPLKRNSAVQRGRAARAQRFARRLVASALLAVAAWLSPDLAASHPR